MTKTLRIQVAEAFRPFLKAARYKALYGGRGGAKSHFFAEQIILRCYEKETRAVCIREVQSSLKDSVKQLLEDKIEKFGLGNFFKVKETEITAPNGSIIIFKGMQSYNAQSIKSLEGYDIAWVEEAQTLSSISLRLLRPTMRKPGSEIWFSWNPRYKTDPVDKFFRAGNIPEDAIIAHVGYKDNPWFPSVLRAELNQDFQNDPDMAAHIWDGDYEIVSEGAYYSKLILQLERNNCITNVPYDPEYPVYTAWDLGLDDSTAIWFVQIIGAEIRVIDFYEQRNVALIDIAKEVLAKPYVYAEHYLPHDVETREISTAKTRKEQLEAVNLMPIRAGSKLPVADGINAARSMLPKCRFDREKTEAGLDALRSYRTELDEKRDTYKPKPLHDWSSHAADAFRELAVNLYDVKGRKEALRQQQAQIEYDVYSHGMDSRDTHVVDYDPYSYQ